MTPSRILVAEIVGLLSEDIIWHSDDDDTMVLAAIVAPYTHRLDLVSSELTIDAEHFTGGALNYEQAGAGSWGEAGTDYPRLLIMPADLNPLLSTGTEGTITVYGWAMYGPTGTVLVGTISEETPIVINNDEQVLRGPEVAFTLPPEAFR